MKSKAPVKQNEPSRKVDKYWVPIVAKTLDLLDCFGSVHETLTLEEVVRRTGIPHTTAFRILHTLVIRDYLSQSGRQYRLSRLRKKLKFGFANLSRHIQLAVEIQDSLEKSALSAGVNLVVWDNDRNADTAIRNAEQMVAEKVDLAIEFQLFEQVAPVISDIFARAGIPLGPSNLIWRAADLLWRAVCVGVALALLAALPKLWNYISFLWRERTPALQWRLDYVYACFALFIAAAALRFAWEAVRRR